MTPLRSADFVFDSRLIDLLVFSSLPPLSGSISVSTFLIILAGLPATTWKAGIFLVTTLPAPTVAPFPILTPGRTVTCLISSISAFPLSRASYSHFHPARHLRPLLWAHHLQVLSSRF